MLITHKYSCGIKRESQSGTKKLINSLAELLLFIKIKHIPDEKIKNKLRLVRYTSKTASAQDRTEDLARVRRT